MSYRFPESHPAGGGYREDILCDLDEVIVKADGSTNLG